MNLTIVTFVIALWALLMAITITFRANYRIHVLQVRVKVLENKLVGSQRGRR